MVFEATVRNEKGAIVKAGQVVVYDGKAGNVLGSSEFDQKGRFRVSVPRPFREPRYVQVTSESYRALGFPFVVSKGTRRVVGSVVLATGTGGATDSYLAPNNATLQAVLRIIRRELEEYTGVGGALPGILMRLDPETKIAVGKSVPSFNLALFDGVYRGSDFISDEAFSGVTYVLVFWGTWCSRCIATMPELHDLWQRYGGSDFQVVSLAADAAESVQRFRKEYWSMPWLHVILEGDLGRTVLEHFEATSFPTTILVDQNGSIVSLRNPGEGLEAEVEGLLK